MKTFVLTDSKTFPVTHKLKGEETYFPVMILSGQKIEPFSEVFCEKIHTIRANYQFWEKRIKQIQKGEAILSIRNWSGKPYNSKQVEICQLDATSGIGIQKLQFHNILSNITEVDYDTCKPSWPTVDELAKNDGLLPGDFLEWFRGYDLTEPMAIIQFTSFRY